MAIKLANTRPLRVRSKANTEMPRADFFLVIKSGEQDLIPIFLNLDEDGNLKSGRGGNLSYEIVDALLELSSSGGSIECSVEQREPKEREEKKVNLKLL